MKIQRWSQYGFPNLQGMYVKFDDIAHLLPTENPDWEPCEIETEATHVMNAQGKTFPIDRVPTGCDWVVVWLSPDVPAKFYQMHLPKCCLTPVRRRKVEPVVFEAFTCNGGLVVADSRLKDGQKVRVTVEVIQGDK